MATIRSGCFMMAAATMADDQTVLAVIRHQGFAKLLGSCWLQDRWSIEGQQPELYSADGQRLSTWPA